MCLILLAVDADSDYPLIVAANRDEFHQRPSAAAHFWPDHPRLLAGRDLQAGGTWMGVTLGGRFAAVTNFSEQQPPANPRSRGELTHQFLLGEEAPKAYVERIASCGSEYRGFNLIVGTPERGYFYYCNRTGTHRALGPGVYGLSNDSLDTPWPKVVHGVRVLTDNAHSPSVDALIAHLASRDVPSAEDLPGEPGVELEVLESEHALRRAATFIDGEVFGTRSSTVMIQSSDGWVEFTEQNYHAAGEPGAVASFRFQLGSDLAHASSV